MRTLSRRLSAIRKNVFRVEVDGYVVFRKFVAQRCDDPSFQSREVDTANHFIHKIEAVDDPKLGPLVDFYQRNPEAFAIYPVWLTAVGTVSGD